MTTPVPTRRIVIAYDSAREDRIVINDPERGSSKDIHVRCQVRMSVSPRRNRASVTIANLAESTRDSLSGVIESSLDFISDPNGDLGNGPTGSLGVGTLGVGSLGNATRTKEITIEIGGGYCEIDAGLDDQVGRVFEGSVSRIRNRHQKPRWETTMELGDGLTAGVGAVANQDFPRGARLFDVVTHVMRSMALTSGNLTFDHFQSIIGTNAQTELGRGYTVVGNSDKVLTQLLRYTGCEWFIDRGEFYIVQKGKVIDEEAEPIVIEQGVAGGLRADPAILDDGGILVETKFRSDVRIGRLTEVRAKQYVGRWRAEVVEHVLDNRVGEWTTRAILRPTLGILGGITDG